MKTTVLASLVLAIALFAGSSKSHAQVIVKSGLSVYVVPGAPAPDPSSVVFPYSYYAAYPLPARSYVGYGANDFPYYGHPYGKPNDPWTWPYMTEPYYGVLARYYYPPVR